MNVQTMIRQNLLPSILLLLCLLPIEGWAQNTVVRNQDAKVRVKDAQVNIYGSASNYGSNGQWINAGHIRLSGDWYNSSVTVAHHSLTGDWYLVGNPYNNPQVIDGTAEGIFERLHINQNPVVDASLVNQHFTISDELFLVNGPLITSDNALLIMDENATWSGGGNQSFVGGPVRRLGEYAFTFPLGDISNHSWLPLGISASGTSTSSFTAQYFHQATNQPNLTSGGLIDVNNCEFYKLTKDVAGNDVFVTLEWDDATNIPTCNYVATALSNNTPPNQLSDLRIARWNGTAWTNEGGGSTTGTLSAGSITSTNLITQYGEFTLSEECVDLTLTAPSITCNGGSTDLTLTIAGGSGTYDVLWTWTMPTPGSLQLTGQSGSTIVLASQPAGDYAATVMNGSGCTTTAQLSISEPASMTSVMSMTEVTCLSGSDGTATAAISGGTAPYNYEWANDALFASTLPQTTALVTGLAEGTYFVRATDNNGCTAIDQVTVTTAPLTQPSVNTVAGELCNSITPISLDPNGTIQVTDVGCNGVYEFMITDVADLSGNCPVGSNNVITESTNSPEMTFANLCNFMRYDHRYEVQVRFYIPNGTGMAPTPGTPQTLTAWSAACVFETEPIDPIEVFCPTNHPNITMGSDFTTNLVQCAFAYEWTLTPTGTNSGPPITGFSLTPEISLNDFVACQDLQFDETYEMSVRTNAGGCWYDGISTCAFTTPPCPTTQVNSPACFTIVLPSQLIELNQVNCASSYEVQILDFNSGALLSTYIVPGGTGANPTFTLNDIAVIPANTTINIQARPLFNQQPCDANAWGPTCTLTTALDFDLCVTHPVCNDPLFENSGEIEVTVRGGIPPYEMHLYKVTHLGANVAATDLNCISVATVAITNPPNDATHTFTGLSGGMYSVMVFDDNPLRCIDPLLYGGVHCASPPGMTTTSCSPNEFHIGELYLLNRTIGIDPKEYPKGEFDDVSNRTVCFPQDFNPLNGLMGEADFTPEEQLNQYPLPRFQPGNKLHRNVVNWLDIGDLSGEHHGVTNANLANSAEALQSELAFNWHYTMSVSDGINLLDPSANFGPNPNTFRGRMIQFAQQNSDITSSALVSWSQLPTVSATQRAFIDNNGWNNSNLSLDHFIYNSATNVPLNDNFGVRMWNPAGINTNYVDPAVRQHIIDDGQRANLHLTYLQGLLGNSQDLDLLQENGEVRHHMFYNQVAGLLNTAVSNDFGGYIGSWYEYLSERKFEMRELYRDQFEPSLPADAAFSWYQIDGYGGQETPGWYPHYGEHRSIGTEWDNQSTTFTNLQRYSTADFYVRRPNTWDRISVGADHGWMYMDRARFNEINGVNPIATDPFVDMLCSPAVAAGWHHDPTQNVRPGQWLGLLKALSLTGAEFFYPGYFDETLNPTPVASWRVPAYRAWQASTPAYAQAITSRYEDILRNGTLIESTGPIGTHGHYSLTNVTGSGQLVLARQHPSEDLYVITGLRGVKNNAGCTPINDEANITLAGASLSFNVRRQGSTYVYDNSGPEPVFFQLDRWHQYEHPDWWTKDLIWEAEVWDSSSSNNHLFIATQDEFGDDVTGGDYTEFVSYVGVEPTQLTSLNSAPWDPIGANEGPFLQYDFQVREANTDYTFWMKSRTQGAITPSSAFVTILDAETGFVVMSEYLGCLLNNEAIGNNDDDFRWYSTGLCNPGTTGIAIDGLQPDHTYWLRITPEDEFLEIDSLALVVNGSPDHDFANSSDLGTLASNCTPAVAPVADFDWRSACTDNETQFENLSTPQLSCASYNWDFGDGITLQQPTGSNPGDAVTGVMYTTGTYQHPIHVYQMGGDHDVALTITIPGGSNTRIHTVDVGTPPTVVASFITRFDESGVDIGNVPTFAGDLTICQGESAQLNALPGTTGAAPFTYHWESTINGSGQGLDNPNVQNPTFDLDQPHSYEVTIIDDFGCTGTDQIEIEVMDLAVDADLLSCTGNPTEVQLSALAQVSNTTNPLALNGLAYQWTTTTVNSLSPPIVSTYSPSATVANPTVTPTMINGDEAEFTIEIEQSLTGSAVGCKANDVTVLLAAPDVNFSIEQPCLGSPTNFDAFHDDGSPFVTNLTNCSEFNWNIYGPFTGPCPYTGALGTPIATQNGTASAFNFDFEANSYPTGFYVATLQVVNLYDNGGAPALEGSFQRCFEVFDPPTAVIMGPDPMGSGLIDIGNPVGSGPTPVVVTPTSPYPVDGTTSTFPSNHGPFSYTWSPVSPTNGGLNPGQNSTPYNQFYAPLLPSTFQNGGIYTYRLKVEDGHECTATRQFAVQICDPAATVEINTPSPTIVYYDDQPMQPCISLSSLFPNGTFANPTYTWSNFPAVGTFSNSSGANTDYCIPLSINVNDGDQIFINLTVTDGGCTLNTFLIVTFHNYPAANTTALMCNPINGCEVEVDFSALSSTPIGACMGANGAWTCDPICDLPSGTAPAISSDPTFNQNVSDLIDLGFYFGACSSLNMMTLPNQSGTAENATEIPTNILLDVFPNPFREGTTVELTLPTSEQVALDVLDITGRQVLGLYEGAAEAGETIRLDLSGQKLKSGVYFVRLVSAGEVLEQRIVRLD